MVIELTTPGIVYVLFRQRWVIVGFLSFCLFLAVAYCVIATSKYQADAAVVVNFSRQITGDTSAARGDEIINSYGMVLQSDALAEQVINEVGLAKIYPYLARPPSALGRAITG